MANDTEPKDVEPKAGEEFGTKPTPEGLVSPSIDELMQHADSKYALAIFAAKRARQINSYFTQLNEGLLQNVGPLVEYQNNEKPLSIAFREINDGLLEETLGEDDLTEGN
ncbi:DNA-directed RNA polymerase subunit omega [Bifidobacterium rousetti]|uniref:DNA-directed RNA polymerase subunit omega n=1 Tax=Bifidobacterium rousetti TaxID=2045439 RepID=UPI000D1446B0|nr:DNA-directed RNA polymerase subunit omega [Bifidobacterium rousetti]KAA8819853.1 DNA-directed RNA polymerase subunit omega [Bifidobacterium rousetti]PST49599.1 DNA-directed RNA polymerase subunit omega [Bifidobacterium callitrichos]